MEARDKLRSFANTNIIGRARKNYLNKTLDDKCLMFKFIEDPSQTALTETANYCPLDGLFFLMFAAHHTTSMAMSALLCKLYK